MSECDIQSAATEGKSVTNYTSKTTTHAAHELPDYVPVVGVPSPVPC
jgi:hypothetical protein